MNKLLNGIRFHHLGLAVNQPPKAIAFLNTLGYKCPEAVFDPAQGVYLIWCSHPAMPAVEIIYQTVTGGPLDSILTERSELIYHMGFEVDNVEETIDTFKQQGLRALCVSSQKSAVLFDKQAVSFYFVAGFGLIELISPVDQSELRP